MSATPILFEKVFPEGVFRVYADKPGVALWSVKQIHSAKVLPVDSTDLAQQEADGLAVPWKTASGGVLAIKTADCLPILVLGKAGCALLHAGWRGLATPILAAPEVAALLPQGIFVGPCIHACCFEVTPEFQQHFPSSPLIHSPDGKLRFDLIAEARRQAQRLYPDASFEDSGECTCCLPHHPSYRRDKTTRRNWNCFLPLAK